ncbi:MAG: UMP kinase [Alphaproteobacteria bacterium]
MNKYKRVMLKLSGEGLMGDKEFGLDPATVHKFAKEIAKVHKKNIEICVVIGGGNIFRGISASAKENGIERTSADYMGMLATVMNAIAIQSALQDIGIDSRVQSAIPMSTVCEPYIRRRAIRHMEKGRVVIFAAGTGNPFFTTDTAASLRAVEMNCDVMLKGTQVDGVYDSDPKKNPDAKMYETLDYQDVVAQDLKVMDTAAIVLARDNNIPIIVFNIHKQGAFLEAVEGQGKFTIVQ